MPPTLLSTIGARGLVSHAGPDEGTYGYVADNDESTWRAYPVVDLNKFLTDRGYANNVVDKLQGTKTPIALLPTKASTVFLNLDAFTQLPAPAAAPAPTPKEIPPGDDAVLVCEKNAFYAVSTKDFQALAPIDAGEARILVRRGAVTAAIPQNDLPVGTNCVLINLTQLT